MERLRGLETHLRGRVLAQDHVIPRLAGLFVRGELGLTDPARPKGSVLLTGPTGTGKSEAFQSAAHWACGPDNLVVFDMSEYQGADALPKLLGRDRRDPGQLGRALRRVPRGAFFFDEIDKAHPPLLGVFLQILWDGRVTVATGKSVSFSEHYLGFGSNLGGAEATAMERSGPSGIEEAIRRRLRQVLPPEFLGRLDEILIFRRLSPDAQRRLCVRLLERETTRLRHLGFDLEVGPDLLEYLVREGFDSHLGARPLRRAVERCLRDLVASDLLIGGGGSGRVRVGQDHRGVTLDRGACLSDVPVSGQVRSQRSPTA